MMRKYFLFCVFNILIGCATNDTISVQDQTTIKGIDISNQSVSHLEWDLLYENDFRFVILRAIRCIDTNRIIGQHSYINAVDPNFKRNWNDLGKSNQIRGAYHRFAPGVPAERQFEIFTSHVKLNSNDLPPILDILLIQNNKIEINNCIEWLKLAHDYYGQMPILYMDFAYYHEIRNNLLDTEYHDFFNKLHLMLKSKDKPIIEHNIGIIWQCEQNRHIPGFSEKEVDLNRFLGDSASLREMLIKDLPQSPQNVFKRNEAWWTKSNT